MYRSSLLFRIALALILVNLCWSEEIHRSKPMKRKYPSKVFEMYKEQLLKTRGPKISGVWSPWSPWSPCSRTCGGGVMHQTRHCVAKPQQPGITNNTTVEGNDKRIAHKHRRRRQSRTRKANHCVGLYKRIHLCNVQECPIPRDFRAEQCANFNNRPYKGIVYIWEPYIKATDECALNCLAVGGGFYATLNHTVIDGTPCVQPLTITGKQAPPGTGGVCVDGQCKSISSNGIIGAIDDSQQECAACLRGNCKNVSGLYTRPDLADGYNFVAQIPQGACRILVQQLKPTSNIIALRLGNGSFILNGGGKFTNSRVVEGAGTRFSYRKQDSTSLETVTSPGPLTAPVEIMIVAYQLNPGIKYGYSVPVDTDLDQIAPPLIQPMSNDIGVEPRRLEVPTVINHQRDEAKRPQPHRRFRSKRRVVWKMTGTSSCSKTCGGGIETPIFTCVRVVEQTPVPSRRCMHLEKPVVRTVSCNTQKCPSINWGGQWGPCTGSCGEGLQHYMWKCVEEEPQTERMLTVDDSQCPQPKPTSSSKPCILAPCENNIINALPQTHILDNRKVHHKWHYGSWSTCSVTCGKGHRTREVTCPTDNCRPDLRPAHAEHCDEGLCPNPNKPTNWLLTEWSQCSEGCGTGNQTRRAHCYRDECDNTIKPETVRACSSDKECSGRWFTGPWGPCSDACDGPAKEVRDVLCVIKVKGQNRIAMDMMCTSSSKPESERACRGDCKPFWFTGEWTTCEGDCPRGTQSREVRCFDANGQYSSACKIEEMPTPRRECTCSSLEEHRERYKPIHDEPPVDRNCVDKVRNCHLAVQARLCMYKYYTTHCCVSCSRAPQEGHE